MTTVPVTIDGVLFLVTLDPDPHNAIEAIRGVLASHLHVVPAPSVSAEPGTFQVGAPPKLPKRAQRAERVRTETEARIPKQVWLHWDSRDEHVDGAYTVKEAADITVKACVDEGFKHDVVIGPYALQGSETPSLVDVIRSVPRPEGMHPEVHAIGAMAAHFRKLGDEPCSECGYSLNEIGAYVQIVVAAKELCRSGYDGPFSGDAVAPLFRAVAEYEASTETGSDDTVPVVESWHLSADGQSDHHDIKCSACGSSLIGSRRT